MPVSVKRHHLPAGQVSACGERPAPGSCRPAHRCSHRAPAANPYDTLKAALLERTTASERKRFQELLSAEDLGDRRPTELLRHMQNLLGERAVTFDASFLKQLFLQRLPPTVQMILTSASTLSLPELALLADKVMEVATHSISAIPPAAITNPPIRPHPQACPPTAPPTADPIVQLREDFERLSATVASAVAPRSPRPRHRSPRRFGSRSSSRRRSPRRTAEDPPIGPCSYHQRFGTEARRCTRPSTWSGNATGDR
ncbi:uncharacterized protein LOC135382628 [Ornithodoros turicata]|uniref:uncharacterized protein LOC135382628 n=1 Tax=Ornithodoros turicata TaxID=34597 RepID=UPI003138DD9F